MGEFKKVTNRGPGNPDPCYTRSREGIARVPDLPEGHRRHGPQRWVILGPSVGKQRLFTNTEAIWPPLSHDFSDVALVFCYFLNTKTSATPTNVIIVNAKV